MIRRLIQALESLEDAIRRWRNRRKKLPTWSDVLGIYEEKP